MSVDNEITIRIKLPGLMPRLRRERRNLDDTAGKIAKKAGMGIANLYRLEKANTIPLTTLFSLLQVIGGRTEEVIKEQIVQELQILIKKIQHEQNCKSKKNCE